MNEAVMVAEQAGNKPLGVLAALPQELGDLVDAMRAEGAMRTV
ncbi:MAG TPA: 5'-methylthioadenosine/adenosylhomocysteine nucleosidase, partial [Trinickia sp.]|nr:5'-methylthioadenosine/adenosylhomocysteine nucleosidase [Trinickia sp.]